MAATLDGPRLAAKSQRTKQLVVFLHGYGANGNDLIAIGKQWRNLMPDAAFVAPNAPEPCGHVPGGRQWFRLTMQDPDERWTGVNKARPALERFSRRRTRSLRPRRQQAGFGRLQPRDDARASCRIAAPAGARGHPRLFGRTCRSRAARSRPIPPQARRRIPAHSSDPWQRGRRYSGGSAFPFGERSWRGPEFRVSGIFRAASDMGSTAKASCMAACSWPNASV